MPRPPRELPPPSNRRRNLVAPDDNFDLDPHANERC